MMLTGSICQMRKSTKAISLIVAAIGCLMFLERGLSAEAQAIGAAQFTVFDGTLYKDKPNLAEYGLTPISIMYVSSFYFKGDPRDDLPPRDRVDRLAKRLPANSWAVVDIEHWPVQGSPSVVAESVHKYSEILRWVHEAVPDLKVGLYGVLPMQDYHRVVRGQEHEAYRDWQRDNDRLSVIAVHADALFPSAYTHYADRDEWVRYATEQIREARRFGKPVYIFLWPQYHDSNRLLSGRFIPRDYWALQLRTARRYADGIVIWGGWDGGPVKWNDRAPWWQETKRFMSELRSTSVTAR